MRLLAFRERQRHFHAPVLEIHAQRHEGHAALDGLADQLADFVLVQQQLARAHRRMIGVPAVAVRLNVHVVHEDFPILHLRVAVAQVHTTLPDRFHLGAKQRDAGLERLDDVVVVVRLAVLRDVLLRGFAFGFFGFVAVSRLEKRAYR